MSVCWFPSSWLGTPAGKLQLPESVPRWNVEAHQSPANMVDRGPCLNCAPRSLDMPRSRYRIVQEPCAHFLTATVPLGATKISNSIRSFLNSEEDAKNILLVVIGMVPNRSVVRGENRHALTSGPAVARGSAVA